jgi:HEAT repeat protein
MAQYPFDQKFRDIVEKLPGAGDPIGPWDILITYETPGVQLSRALVDASYSIEQASNQIRALKALPVNNLIELALGDRLEHSPALIVLQQSRSREVFEAMVKRTVSHQASDRKLAALVLMRDPGRTYEEEASAAIAAMTAIEIDEEVLGALAYAVKHLGLDNCTEFLSQVAQSKNAETRYAAAFALGGRSDDALAIKTLIALSKDSDDDVRDWATFGLYLDAQHQQPVTENIKEALFARIDDTHDETRYQAIAGLASCQDLRVIEPLIAALESNDVWHLALEAAKELGHPAFYPSLVKLREDFPSDKLVAQALLACTPKSAE